MSTGATFSIRPFVSLPIASRTEFWSRYLTEGMENGGLFLPGFSLLEAGETVDVEVGFLEEGIAIQAQYVVRGAHNDRGKEGTRVEFLPDALSSRDLMLRFVGGEKPASRQMHRRYPMEMRAEIEGKKTVEGKTLNMSLGGVQLGMGASGDVGKKVRVRLRPSDLSVLDLGARVVWSGPQRCGLEFEYANASEQHLLAGLLDLARQRVMVVF